MFERCRGVEKLCVDLGEGGIVVWQRGLLVTSPMPCPLGFGMPVWVR